MGFSVAYKGEQVGMSSSSQGLWTPNLTKRQSLRRRRRIRAVSKTPAPNSRSTLKHGPTFHPLSSNMLGVLRGDQMGEIPEAQQSPGWVPGTLLGHHLAA